MELDIKKARVEFGQKLHEYREALHLSQTDLSALVTSRTGTPCHSGTVSHIEDGHRGPPECKVLAEILIEKAREKKLSYNENDFRTLRNLAALAGERVAKTPTKSRDSAVQPVHLLKYKKLYLEEIEKITTQLQQDLYNGKGGEVLQEAGKRYSRLKKERFPRGDKDAMKMLIRVGMLFGQAQEIVIPWYQRRKPAIRIYDEVAYYLASLFPDENEEMPGQFHHYLATINLSRAQMYREMREFHDSDYYFEKGIKSAQRIGDRDLEAALRRNQWHLLAMQGYKDQWENEYIEVKEKSGTSKAIESLLDIVRGSGYRRFAYDPDVSPGERKHFARQALAAFDEAERIYPNLWPSDAPVLATDAHPYTVKLLRLQAMLWEDVNEAVKGMEQLRTDAHEKIPALEERITETIQYADKIKQWNKKDTLPAFNLDRKMRKG